MREKTAHNNISKRLRRAPPSCYSTNDKHRKTFRTENPFINPYTDGSYCVHIILTLR